MENKYLKMILYVQLVMCTIASYWVHTMSLNVLFVSILIYGVLIIETRSIDTVKQIRQEFVSLRADLNVCKQEWNAMRSGSELASHQWGDLADKVVRMETELTSMEPEKIKLQMQTLIDSNNQLVLNMRNQSGSY